jgi:hypothetical protein
MKEFLLSQYAFPGRNKNTLDQSFPAFPGRLAAAIVPPLEPRNKLPGLPSGPSLLTPFVPLRLGTKILNSFCRHDPHRPDSG